MWFNLRSRGYGAFVRERLRRLLIPLAFGMFVIVPPQVYVERVVAGEHYSSYFDFWGTVFKLVPYPKGNLSWHHLWFLPYILTWLITYWGTLGRRNPAFVPIERPEILQFDGLGMAINRTNVDLAH